jgi:adenylyltransferase/sulfurtransferase
VAGLAANIAATEGIKLLAGLGEPLVGTLLVFDTLNMRFQRVPITRRADCVVCGHLRP